MCERLACPNSTAAVDHVVPLAEGGDRYNHSNYMALCQPHHTHKTTQDALRGKTRPR